MVSHNQNKKPTFTVKERIDMIKKVTKNIPNVFVTSYDGLIVNYCKANGINIIIRGLRNYQDYETEFSLFQFNKGIDNEIETMLMLPSNKHIFVSSSAIKELVSFKADISAYVPLEIVDTITKKYQN